MNASLRKYRPALLLAIAGLLSALLSIGMAYYPTWLRFPFFPGTLFGVTVSASLGLSGALRKFWNLLAIPVASTLAYYVAFIVGGEFDSPFSREGTVSNASLFVGGLTGAFLVLSMISLLLDSTTSWQRRVLNAVCWSPVGGALGIVGGLLGLSLGMALWFLVHSLGLTSPDETFQNARGEPSQMFSIWMVWQTGMRALLGFVLRYTPQGESE
jgi:hypothetical protein